MAVLRGIVLGILIVAVASVMGCSGSDSTLLYQTISERSSWAVNDFLAFTAFGGNGQKYVYRCTKFGAAQILLTRSDNDLDVDDEGGWHPAHSPDGGLIAFAARRNGGTTSLFTMHSRDGDRVAMTQVTNAAAAGQDMQPNWKPDGTQIVFTTDKVIGGGTGSLDIAVINPDGTILQYVIATAEVEQWPAFNPAGTMIAYQVGPIGGPTDIHIWDVAAATDANLTAALRAGAADTTRFECPAWGNVAGEEWIYFHSDRDGDFDIFRVRPTGADFQQITNDARSDGYPVINPDGDRILFTRDRELWTRDPVAGDGNERRLTRRY